jgi:hypothetical protein
MSKDDYIIKLLTILGGRMNHDRERPGEMVLVLSAQERGQIITEGWKLIETKE